MRKVFILCLLLCLIVQWGEGAFRNKKSGRRTRGHRQALKGLLGGLRRRGQRFIRIDTESETSDIPECGRKDIKMCQKAHVNLHALRRSRTIRFPDGTIMTRNERTVDAEKGYASATFSNEQGDNAIIAYPTWRRAKSAQNPSDSEEDSDTFENDSEDERKTHVQGVVHIGERLFQIDFCGEGCGQLWVELDKDKMPKDDPSKKDTIDPEDVGEDRMLLSPRDQALLNQGLSDKTTIVTVSVIVYYTDEFAAVTQDIPAYVAEVFVETNEAYVNSKIPLRMVLHCLEAAPGIKEVEEGPAMLEAFKVYKGGNPQLLKGSADIAMLLVSDSSICGISVANTPHLALGMAQKDCALGYFTFGHEMAHMFGANHNEEAVKEQNYLPYSYGELLDGTKYRTVMSYYTPDHTRKVNYYSSSDPSVIARGVKTGDAGHDNARALIERRFLMAGQGDESRPCSDGTRGAFEETRPINGGWSDWTLGQCSVTCGVGYQQRTRTCDNPAPINGGTQCFGPPQEHLQCFMPPCPGQPIQVVNGGWSVWSLWGQCSATCGEGFQERSRLCNNPAPGPGGAPCQGQPKENRPCNLGSCPPSATWSEWTDFGSCSVTCGSGFQKRTRQCITTGYGVSCYGRPEETRTCQLGPCPVNGGWSMWTYWDRCSATCGGGTQSRTRTCTDPSPSYGGLPCPGDSQVDQTCNTNPCPPSWSDWSDWGSCSVTCGYGQESRTRTCSKPFSCYGNSQERRQCNAGQCPPTNSYNSYSNLPVTEWGPWSFWSSCSVTCGQGVQTRTRPCAPGTQCIGQGTESKSCDAGPCGGYSPYSSFQPSQNQYGPSWNNWGSWSQCSVSCGDGNRFRTRTCDGYNCVGSSRESENCNNGDCLQVNFNLVDYSPNCYINRFQCCSNSYVKSKCPKTCSTIRC